MAVEEIGNVELLKYYEIIDTVVKIGLGALITGIFSLLNNFHHKTENEKNRNQEIVLKNNDRFYSGYNNIFKLLNELSIEIKLYSHEGWNLFYKLENKEPVDERFSNFIETHDVFLLNFKKIMNNIKIQLHLLTIDNFEDHIEAIGDEQTDMIDVFALKTQDFFKENYSKDEGEIVDYKKLMMDKRKLLDEEVEKLLGKVNGRYIDFLN